jgi:polyferredoxin
MTVQLIFLLLSVWIGIEFYLFTQSLQQPLSPYYHRPPGVEAYLPISAFMSFVYFVQTGIVHPVHPAGFFLFLAFGAVSLILGKSFCSWICPIGFLSEYIGSFGEKLFRRKLKLPRWLDYPLRSLKYLLFFFFLFSITGMTTLELKFFLDADYNKAADIKLFDFFRDISRFSLIVLSALVLLSIPFRNFWCRYLCPYGALFGVFSVLSPVKITRNANTCTACGECDAACPSFINVSTVKRVVSDECTSCMQCLDICPIEQTLSLQQAFNKREQGKRKIILFAIFVHLIILLFAISTDNWQNTIGAEEYRSLYLRRESLGH